MTSDAVVTFVADKLGELASDEAQLRLGVRGEIKWMKKELEKMRSFLKDADSKQKEDAEVRKLVAKIREICFDVDDFIGTIIDGQTENRTTGFAEIVTRFFGDLTTRYKNHKEIGRLKQKISDISRRRDDYGIRDINEGRQAASEAVVSYIVGKLGDLLIQEAQLLSGVHEGVEWIKNELERMQCFLKDADSKIGSDARVKKWVSDIRDVSYETEDLIENFMDSQKRRHGPVGRVKSGISKPNTIHEVAKHIEQIKQKISDISRRRDDYGIRDINEGRQEASEAVVRKLGDLLIQEAQLLSGVREGEGVEWIKNELERMQCFLKDADSKINSDVRVKNWVSDVRDVSYEMEDLIETFIDSQSRRHGLIGGLKRYISEYVVAKKIEQIKQKIHYILSSRETFGIMDINEERQEASSWIRDLEGRRRYSVMLGEAQLVGQHEEFRTVRDQLMTEEQRRRVISIFGMGGSGKTALAKKVLNDVKDHFDCHALVYVSQQCKFKDVLVRIIKGVAGHSAQKGIENMDEVDLGLMLRDDYLRGKRYLVVLDDIWTREAWDSLILQLPDVGIGSRVLVTTRIRDVALYADHHHEMRLLNDHESWELFMKKIFPEKDPSTACPPELQEIGWKILKKCGGLPLAILVLGGLLARVDMHIVWSKVLHSVNHHLTESSCMEILALSYYDLPHYLKSCFLYFGLFPENYEISSGKLIRLWIAEGFIQQEGNKLMEDVAEDYLEKLVSRNMIQVARKRSNGSIHKCHIHNILRVLSISKARENNLFTVHNDDNSSSSSTSVRRLAVYHNIDGDETKNHSIESLRSIFYFFNSKVDVLKLPNTSSKLLRVMNTESEEYSNVSLPKEVGEFVHLRFLEFSRTYRFRSIPPSIGNLSSLQTLKVFEDSRGILPNTIWNLKELRHLHAHFHIKGDPHLSNLRNLQTLFLKADSWIEEGLGRLTNLRKLGILGDVSSYHDTLPYCIEKLRNLRILKLVENWTRTIPSFLSFLPFTHHKDLYKIHLEVHIKKLPELPPNLVELYLCGSELKEDAISTLEKLQHLKILKLVLRSYLGKQMICSPGGFPQLEFLELQSLPLEEWRVDDEAMISLKSVKLIGMSELKTDTLPERVRGLLEEGELL